MDWIFVIILLIIIVAAGVAYYIYTLDTYIVRVNKHYIMEFKTAMDLTGLPIITFYQGKTKYNFLLDTGSNISYVNSKSDIQVVKTGKQDVFMGASGEDIPCEWATIKLYKDDTEYDCAVTVADLDAAFTELKNCYGVSLSGILGNDFFIKYRYCLDFKELVAYSR